MMSVINKKGISSTNNTLMANALLENIPVSMSLLITFISVLAAEKATMSKTNFSLARARCSEHRLDQHHFSLIPLPSH